MDQIHNNIINKYPDDLVGNQNVLDVLNEFLKTLEISLNNEKEKFILEEFIWLGLRVERDQRVHQNLS